MEEEKLSKSKQTAAKTVYAAFKVLKEAGGELPGREVIEKIRKSLDFSDWEKEIYEKSGYVRWESILHFYSIDCIKAGFLRKNKGIWYLTKEGEKALELEPVKLLETASITYKKSAEENIPKKIEQSFGENGIEQEIGTDLKQQKQKVRLEQLEEEATSGIKDHIFNKNPYDFQDIVAALLRAMDYHTPFISPKGRDGGIDIVAYQDPLGAKEPRIKVQVKHKPTTAIPVDDIRSLVGLLNKNGDIGLFITSGQFSNDAKRFARDSHIHVRLIDMDDFIALWQKFYNKLPDEEKNWLPLHPIYFLGSNE